MKIEKALTMLRIAGLAIASIWVAPSIFGQIPDTKDATPVSKGNPTVQEKEFSKEFDKRYPDRQRTKLSKAMPEHKDIGVGIGGRGDYVGFDESSEARFDRIFTPMVCAADIAVVGRPSSNASHLSVDETYIYTQYDFKVEDVVFNNTGGVLAKEGTLVVGWPGGQVKSEGRLIEVIDFGYSQLKTGSKYLLFLRYLPSAKGYVPFNNNGDFEFEKEILRPNSYGELRSTNFTYAPQDLLTRTRNSIKDRCRKK